jgi:hypothetical protein
MSKNVYKKNDDWILLGSIMQRWPPRVGPFEGDSMRTEVMVRLGCPVTDGIECIPVRQHVFVTDDCPDRPDYPKRQAMIRFWDMPHGVWMFHATKNSNKCINPQDSDGLSSVNQCRNGVLSGSRALISLVCNRSRTKESRASRDAAC